MSRFGNLKIALGLGQDLLMIRFKWEPLNRMGCKRFKCYRFDQIAKSNWLIFHYERINMRKGVLVKVRGKYSFFAKVRGNFSFAKAQGK